MIFVGSNIDYRLAHRGYSTSQASVVVAALSTAGSSTNIVIAMPPGVWALRIVVFSGFVNPGNAQAFCIDVMGAVGLTGPNTSTLLYLPNSSSNAQADPANSLDFFPMEMLRDFVIFSTDAVEAIGGNATSALLTVQYKVRNNDAINPAFSSATIASLYEIWLAPPESHLGYH